MNWQLDINILITLLTIAATAGMGWMRVNTLERDLQRIEKEVIDAREMRASLAVVQSKLNEISQMLDRLTRRIEVLNHENHGE